MIRPDIGYFHVPDFADLDEFEGFEEVLQNLRAPGDHHGPAVKWWGLRARVSDGGSIYGAGNRLWAALIKVGSAPDDFEEEDVLLEALGSVKYLASRS